MPEPNGNSNGNSPDIFDPELQSRYEKYLSDGTLKRDPQKAAMAADMLKRGIVRQPKAPASATLPTATPSVSGRGSSFFQDGTDLGSLTATPTIQPNATPVTGTTQAATAARQPKRQPSQVLAQALQAIQRKGKGDAGLSSGSALGGGVSGTRAPHPAGKQAIAVQEMADKPATREPGFMGSYDYTPTPEEVLSSPIAQYNPLTPLATGVAATIAARGFNDPESAAEAIAASPAGQAQAAARAATRSGAPTVAGVAGFHAAAPVGTAIGNTLFPEAEGLGGVVGGAITGTAGALGAGKVVASVQDKAIGAILGPQAKQALDALTVQDATDYPGAVRAGSIAPMLAFQGPMSIEQAVQVGQLARMGRAVAPEIRQAAIHTLRQSATGALMQGGISAGTQLAETGHINPGETLFDGAVGLLFPNETSAGKRVAGAGKSVAGNFATAVSPAAKKSTAPARTSATESGSVPVPPADATAVTSAVDIPTPVKGSHSRIGITDHASLAEALRDVYGYSEPQARDTATKYESFARGWAQQGENRTVEQFYRERLAGVTKGDEDLARAMGGSGTERAAVDNAGSHTLNPDDARRVLIALRSPDVSSVPHELAHIFFDSLTPAEQDAYLTSIGESRQENGSVPVQAHEQFASGYEETLRRGGFSQLHPSLKGLFERFQGWIGNVYRRFYDLAAKPGQAKGTPIEWGYTHPDGTYITGKAEPFRPEVIDTLKRYFGDVSDITGEGKVTP